jgi:acyl-CoA thioesterase
VAAPLFGDTLTIARARDNCWRGDADPEYSNGAGGNLVGQFGGWIAAALLKSVLGDAQAGQHARSIVVHFTAATRPGPLEIRTRCLRQGRSVAFWQAELFQGEDLRAHAVVTVGEVRDDPHAHTFIQRPDAPPPDGLRSFSPPTPFGRRMEARWVLGEPFQGKDGARSLFWGRTNPPTRLDASGLALRADHMPPRVFYKTNSFIPNTTLSLTAYFHGTPEEIEAVGEDYLLVDVLGRRINAGYWDHTTTFWSPSGALIATTEQLALHRG